MTHDGVPSHQEDGEPRDGSTLLDVEALVREEFEILKAKVDNEERSDVQLELRERGSHLLGDEGRGPMKDGTMLPWKRVWNKPPSRLANK